MSRVVVGCLLAIGWVALLFKAPFMLFWIAVLAGSAIALEEYFRLVFPGALKSFRLWAVLAGILPVLASFQGNVAATAAGLVIAIIVIIVLAIQLYALVENGFDFLARLGFGVYLVGFCTAHLVLLRLWEHGPSWLFVLSAITASSDISAYYTGRLFGRTKLCPAVSPGKTRAGAAGGLLAGTIAAILAASWLFPGASLVRVGICGFVVTGVGIFGDLTESIMKRATGAKDSGTMLLGHGGLLDRCDSLMLAAPVFYYLLYFGLLAGELG